MRDSVYPFELLLIEGLLEDIEFSMMDNSCGMVATRQKELPIEVLGLEHHLKSLSIFWSSIQPLVVLHRYSILLLELHNVDVLVKNTFSQIFLKEL